MARRSSFPPATPRTLDTLRSRSREPPAGPAASPAPCDRAQHHRVGDLHFFRMWEQVIVYPAGEDRCFHSDRPRLRQRLHPGVQLPPCGANLSFLVNAAAHVLHAVADRFLVNIQADVVHMSVEEPP